VKERAHAQVVLIFQDGKLQRVRIDRGYNPDDLPEI
jgi:hypothetical protein